MNEQIQDSYLKYLEDQESPKIVESVPSEHKIDPTSSILQLVCIIILFITSIVLLFGWSSARNNPFSVIGKNIPLELWPGARNPNVLIKDSLVGGIKGNLSTGNLVLKLKLENKSDLQDKIIIDSDIEVKTLTDNSSNSSIDLKVNGSFDFWNGKQVYNFSNKDFHYLQKGVNGEDFVNLDLPENLKDIFSPDSIIDKNEIFGKDVSVSKTGSIFNSLIFKDKLSWQSQLSFPNLLKIFGSSEFVQENKAISNSVISFFELPEVKRVGRELDDIGRNSIKYEINSTNINNQGNKDNLVKSIFLALNTGSKSIISTLCDMGNGSISSTCAIELEKYLSSTDESEKLKFENFLSKLEISNVFIWIDPVQGFVNKISFQIDLPEDIIRREVQNIIGNYTVTGFSLKFSSNNEESSEQISVDKSKYTFDELLELLKE